MFEPAGSTVSLESNGESKILVLSGEPIDKPVASYGPFVMNTQQEIAQALQDYHTGKMGTLTR